MPIPRLQPITGQSNDWTTSPLIRRLLSRSRLKASPSLQHLDTLPERFAKHGYKTLAAGKLFHTRDNRFFEEYGGSMGGFGPRPKNKISQPHGHPLWDWGAYPEKDEDMPDYKIAKWAVEKLKKLPADSEKPFFMGVGFYRPHVPMYAPKKWFDLFPLDQIKLPPVKEDDRADLSSYAIALTNEKHVSRPMPGCNQQDNGVTRFNPT